MEISVALEHFKVVADPVQEDVLLTSPAVSVRMKARAALVIVREVEREASKAIGEVS